MMAKDGRSVSLGFGGAVGLAVMLWGAGALAGTDPTPAEIVAGWNALSGAPAKVVYWEADAIRVMDLSTGTSQVVVSSGVPRHATDGGVGPYPVWSPDGTRILYYTIDPWKQYRVVNENGTNDVKVSETVPWTYGCCSWWDNDSVVVQHDAPDYVLQVTIDANNNPTGTQTLIGFAPYGGNGREWVSGNGGYVAWTDWGANFKPPDEYPNRSLVRQLGTGTEMETTPRDEDACSIVLKQDGSGTCVYCYNNHYDVRIKNFSGTEIGTLAIVFGEKIEMLRWSNHPDYICHMNERQLNASEAPLAKAYIRKLVNDNDSGEYLFLGWGMWGPDVWVDTGPPPTYPPTCSISASATQILQGQSVDFSATASDPDGGAIQSYEWDYSYDGTTFNQEDTGQTASHTFSSPGTFTVALQVTDDESETGSATIEIVVWSDDGDGIPDWWEIDHFGSPDTYGAGDDPDMDGLDNMGEYLAGSDPNDEDTDKDGIKDGDDDDPLNPPGGLHGVGGGCGGPFALPFALLIAVVAFRKRRCR